MLLGLSGRSQDVQVSFDVVTGEGESDGGAPNGRVLTGLVEAMWRGEPSRLAEVRREVRAAMGGAALIDAVAVSASFHMMTRIADGTGTPLEAGGTERTAQVRAQIGVDDLVSRCHRDTA